MNQPDDDFGLVASADDRAPLSAARSSEWLVEAVPNGASETGSPSFSNGMGDPRHNGRLVAVVPVRGGSTRCIGKNVRPFAETNLLAQKVKLLLSVKGLDGVIVTSDCPAMLKIAQDLGAIPHKRAEGFSTCSSADFWKYVAEDVAAGSDYIMYSHAVCPFVQKESFEKMIKLFRNLPGEYDCVTSVNEVKRFFWTEERKALNYDPGAPPNSQDLPPYYVMTFGACIIERSKMIEFENCVGKHPLYFELDEIQAFDIDTNLEFVISEKLHEAGINTSRDVVNYTEFKPLPPPFPKPLLLDCTVRDGGYTNNWNFSDKFVADAYAAVSTAGYDFFEIGFRFNTKLYPPNSENGKYAYVTDDMVREIVKKVPNGCKISVMCRMGGFTTDQFQPAAQSPVDMVRVHFPIHDKTTNTSKFSETAFADCVTACRDIKAKGYIVCLNVGNPQMLSLGDLQTICRMVVYSKQSDNCRQWNIDDGVVSSHACCDFLYLADTYGAVDADLAMRLVKKVRFELLVKQQCVDCQVGFHAHNNMHDGLNKALSAIKAGSAIIDSCVHGLGRGAGNLQTEVLICHMKQIFEGCLKPVGLDVEPILHFADIHIHPHEHLPFMSRFTFGPNPLHLMSAFLNIHPDYAFKLLVHYRGLPLSRSIHVLKLIAAESHATNRNNYHEGLLKYAIDQVG